MRILVLPLRATHPHAAVSAAIGLSYLYCMRLDCCGNLLPPVLGLLIPYLPLSCPLQDAQMKGYQVNAIDYIINVYDGS